MKKTALPKNVDDYLATVSKDSRTALTNLRKTIKYAAPKAEEVISYKIPFFKYYGPLVCFAAFANHCSFYVVNKSILKTFSNQLKPFHTAGTTIHFSSEHPLPALLVKKIVKARIKQNEARHKSKINCK
jgi:uncharacterized protein YdhG (YjbR/CyaY superfamily)